MTTPQIDKPYHGDNIKDEISSTTYTEEPKWELIESQLYSSSENSNTANSFNITLLILIILMLGIFVTIVYLRYTKKKSIIKI